MWLAAVLTAAMTFTAAGASAAGSAADPLASGIAAYEASDYPTALAALEAAVAAPTRYSPAQLGAAHRYLAMTLLAFDRADEARDHFVSALVADPTISYDPNLTSPKILRTFNEAKAIYDARQPKPAPPPAAPPAHTWRRPTGWALIGVGGASLATSGAFYGLMWGEHAKYEAEDKSQDKLDQYERQGKRDELIARITVGAGAALTGVGLYFVLSDRGAAAKQQPKAAFLLAPAGPRATPGVTAAWRF
jgi:tetratricopeptide (TPR) repeat protein